MFKRMLIFLFIASSCTHLLSEKIVISLGTRCDVAMQLIHYNLRNVAYPFDWLISPFNAVYTCLEEDFKHFFNKNYLNLYSHSDGVTGVKDSYYGFQFIHDFPTMNSNTSQLSDLEQDHTFMGLVTSNYLDYFETIGEKYTRRINRFRSALSGTNEIIFIRTAITKQEAISLQALIKLHYSNLNFTLVAIDTSSEMHDAWIVPGIKNFYVTDTFTMGNFEWEAILRELELIA